MNIYTREYFQLVHDRLAEGGLATYWVPVARPHPGTDVEHDRARVLRRVQRLLAVERDAVRPDARWLARHAPVRGRSSSSPTPWQTPGLEARLREVGFERAEQIGATFVGDAAYLRELTAPAPPLTDDFPQRLRPSAGRPSLSDPGYGADPAVTRMYQSTLDVSRARAAFSRVAADTRRSGPRPRSNGPLPFFELQAIINRVYWEGGRPLRQIEDLDRVLSTTTLRTLPLWILGSDEVKQRIGEGAASSDGEAAYSRGLRALSGRDFGGAVQMFTAAERLGFRAQPLGPLRAYAFMKSGQLEFATQLAAAAQPADDDEKHFWGWLRGELQKR